MVGHRVQAASGSAESLGAGAALLSDPAMVRWVGVADPDGVHVLLSSGEAIVVAPADGGGSVQAAVDRIGLGPSDPVAIDSPEPPAGVIAALGDRPRRDAATRLTTARARKDFDEIELIWRAAQLATAGQRAVRQRLAPGVSELDLWAAARRDMERRDGGAVEANVDLMVGDRTQYIDGPPGPGVVTPGDPTLFDLAPRRAGYWADSCATITCGPATTTLRRRHDIVRRALEHGLARARDGAVAGQVDAAMRRVLERDGLRCPHHTGHGVGTAAQEPPWLIPGADAVLEEGMVVALEPGTYASGIGVRLEHLAVIAADGARPLTTHSLELT
jgi:Xaa-Pro dipeptidase